MLSGCGCEVEYVSGNTKSWLGCVVDCVSGNTKRQKIVMPILTLSNSSMSPGISCWEQYIVNKLSHVIVINDS